MNNKGTLYDFCIILIMRKFSALIISLALLSGMHGVSRAQQARVSGLEKNADYMQLLRQQQQLRSAEDSTVLLISDSRKSFESTSAEREKIGRDIVRLEGELFEIRNRMGKITAQVAAIEQDFILNHIDSPGSVADGGAKSTAGGEVFRTLFLNDFFTTNLNRNEIALFLVAPKIEPEVVKLNRRIAGLYEQLVTLKRQYDLADDQDIIDSLSTRAGAVKEQIEQVDTEMERFWLPVYTHKLDSYLVLMDRIGNVDRLKLEQLDQESRQVRRAEGLAGEQLAPLVATYPLQKRLALDYEIAMAEILGIKPALDSLTAELKKIPVDNTATGITSIYPDILFAPRNLVVYSPITRADEAGGATTYKSVEDIPTLHVPKKGIYYTVQLGAYTVAPKSLDVFKGMSPLRYQKMSDGRTRYVAGGFGTYSEAQAAVNQMIKAGFKAVTIVAYAEGKATTALKAKALEAAAKPATAATGTTNVKKGIGPAFNVEIIPAELRLPAAMRETITAKAPGKTIVRGMVGSEVVYSVGTFDNKTEAEALANALSTQPKVKIKVVAL